MTVGMHASGSQPVSSDPDSAPPGVASLAITQLAGQSASDADRESDVSTKKRKRVRTGCFTCRDRHLKCDAAQGQCQNCRKSGRQCRRGVRLNFFDTQVVAPPTYIKPTGGSDIKFRDDSRVIASEYVGGFEMYPPPEQVEDIVFRASAPVCSSRSSMTCKDIQLELNRHYSLDDPTALLLMQVFVAQIGPWLDIVDATKHVCFMVKAMELLLTFPVYSIFAAVCHRRAVVARCLCGWRSLLHFSWTFRSGE